MRIMVFEYLVNFLIRYWELHFFKALLEFIHGQYKVYRPAKIVPFNFIVPHEFGEPIICGLGT